MLKAETLEMKYKQDRLHQLQTGVEESVMSQCYVRQWQHICACLYRSWLISRQPMQKQRLACA